MSVLYYVKKSCIRDVPILSNTNFNEKCLKTKKL